MIGLMICGDNSENFGTDTITNYCGTQNKDYTYYLVLNKINSMGVIFHALNEPFPIDKTASALKVYIVICRLQWMKPSLTTAYNSRVKLEMSTLMFRLAGFL